ncbi:MAG: hypothetical protein HN462_01365, partial [Candidatus Marinimicrobia bacterium]|nr:hypothetical protein [Candidatus Neomarinimicrobiota bacterium]
MNIKKQLSFQVFILGFILILGCDPIVETYNESESAIYYSATEIIEAENPPENKIKVMTWNIRFACGRIPFFGDACGDRVILTEEEVLANLDSVASRISQETPDIILLQEVDRSSKRTGYLDQIQYLLDHTYFNYGAYATIWKAQFIPSDGLGRMDMGNVILSKWPLENAERIKLPLREDQPGIVQYFYLRRSILKVQVKIPGQDNFYAVNIHATAFATDDTKQKHVDTYLETLQALADEGAVFVTGGDLNSLPPGADSTDFCMEDFCDGDSYHTINADPLHKDGSYFENFENEPSILQPLYDLYHPAISLTRYLDSESGFFTHAPSTSDRNNTYYDRKLDYLFTNIDNGWVVESEKTHQDFKFISDHMAVSA